MFMPDMVQGSLQGVIRALNVQKRASLIAIASHYMVSLPLAFLLTFLFEMGVKGLWIGMTFGVMLEAIFYVRLVLNTDWQDVANEAQERLKNDRVKTLMETTLSTLDDSAS
jgi:MATE family multidrug resistance protein